MSTTDLFPDQTSYRAGRRKPGTETEPPWYHRNVDFDEWLLPRLDTRSGTGSVVLMTTDADGWQVNRVGGPTLYSLDVHAEREVVTPPPSASQGIVIVNSIHECSPLCAKGELVAFTPSPDSNLASARRPSSKSKRPSAGQALGRGPTCSSV